MAIRAKPLCLPPEMMDVVSPAVRSRMMAGITGKNTEPERIVRSHLHKKGFRFRLHARDLPGKPDLVLPKWNCVVFVHGCFWHRHVNCRYTTVPRTRRAWWLGKFESNTRRDRRNIRRLRRLGWRVFVIWECETSDTGLARLESKIRRHS